jgi:hypothetical protein
LQPTLLNIYAKSCGNPFGGFRYKWGQRFWHMFTVTMAMVAILKIPRPECTSWDKIDKISMFSDFNENLYLGLLWSEELIGNDNNCLHGHFYFQNDRRQNRKKIQCSSDKFKARRKRGIIIIIIIIRNGTKTISLQTSLGDLIIRNGAKTISLQSLGT